MDCPKCGRGMDSGVLQAGNLMAFNKKRYKISISPRDKEDVMIAQQFLTGANFNGWICKECGLVVFDYKNLLR